MPPRSGILAGTRAVTSSSCYLPWPRRVHHYFSSDFFILFQLPLLFPGGTRSIHTVKYYKEFKVAAVLNQYLGFGSRATWMMLLQGNTRCYVVFFAPSHNLPLCASFNIMPLKIPYLGSVCILPFWRSWLVHSPPSLPHTSKSGSAAWISISVQQQGEWQPVRMLPVLPHQSGWEWAYRMPKEWW